jgi:hypothetical protein
VSGAVQRHQRSSKRSKVYGPVGEWDRFTMSISNESTASRRFEAHRPMFGSNWASIWTQAWQQNPVRSSLMMVVAILDFSCSGGDFRLLVEKFGLAPYLQRHDQ